jgi:hypothetical protein
VNLLRLDGDFIVRVPSKLHLTIGIHFQVGNPVTVIGQGEDAFQKVILITNPVVEAEAVVSPDQL